MNKKELIARYKARPVTGGVFKIRNTQNGRYLLASGIDIKGDRNRFNFSVATGSCVHMKLQKDWNTFGPKAFAEDLKMLEQMWRERLDGDEY